MLISNLFLYKLPYDLHFQALQALVGLVRHDLTSLLVVLHMQLSYQLTLSVIISGLDEAVLSRLLLSSIVSPLI